MIKFWHIVRDFQLICARCCCVNLCVIYCVFAHYYYYYYLLINLFIFTFSVYLLCPALGELSGQVPADAASSPGNEHHIPGHISAFARDKEAPERFNCAKQDLKRQKQHGAQGPEVHVGSVRSGGSACGAVLCGTRACDRGFCRTSCFSLYQYNNNNNNKNAALPSFYSSLTSRGFCSRLLASWIYSAPLRCSSDHKLLNKQVETFFCARGPSGSPVVTASPPRAGLSE